MKKFEAMSGKTSIKAISVDGEFFEFVYFIGGKQTEIQTPDTIECFEKLQNHAKTLHMGTATGQRNNKDLLNLL